MISLLIDREAREHLPVATRRLLRRRLARMVYAAWLSEATERELEVCVRLTGDATIHQLNLEYRAKDQATDVLAFAMREAVGTEHMPEVLGDVVISVDTAARQAENGLVQELLFLSAHGLCHLLGYDHPDDEQERVMNQRVHALLRECQRGGHMAPA